MQPMDMHPVLFSLLKYSVVVMFLAFLLALFIKYVVRLLFKFRIKYWSAYIIALMGSLLTLWGRPALGFFFGLSGLGTPTTYKIVDIVLPLIVWTATFQTKLKNKESGSIGWGKSFLLAIILMLIGTALELLRQQIGLWIAGSL